MIKRLVNLDTSSKNPEENQYIQLIKDILQYGSLESGRNGETISIFGSAMYFSLENNSIPIFTSKKVAWKTCLKELLWFIKGDTNNQHLIDQNVTIWRENASRNFLDSRGLTNLQENDLGPVYGHQWRHFNAPYTNCDADYSGQGIDQLQYIINQLKDADPIKRNSRRLIMSAWNPCQIDEMALPPCHILVQFNVSHGNKLSCSLYQRSGDIGLGVPFNIVSYSFLTHILAKHCGLEAHEFIYTIGNAHIYSNHVEALKEQIKNELFVFPKIEIMNSYENINDYTVEDIVITNYKSNSAINMKMIA
jgi:thymidylate synthase